MIRRALRLSVYALAILCCLEISLRILGLPKDYQPHSHPLQFQSTPSAQLGYTNLRLASIDFVYDRNPRNYFKAGNIVQHMTNSDGFRGPEIARNTPADTYQILFLGDSSTFGEGVYFEDTYPERFKALAQERNIFKEKVNAVNLGVSGYETTQECNLLKHVVGSGLQANRVVVGYNLNDADGPLITFKPDGTYDRVKSEFDVPSSANESAPVLERVFRTLRILHQWRLRKNFTEATLAYYHRLYQDPNPTWQDTKTAIAAFAQFQKDSKTPVTFVLLPVLFDLDHYPLQAEEQKVEDELARNGLDYVSIRPALAGYHGPELWVHPTDQHPNEIVHRIVAEVLARHFTRGTAP